MRDINGIEFVDDSQEERLPDFQRDFPCVTSRAHLDAYVWPSVPWHWHKAAELFYVAQGSIQYNTPGGSVIFPAGSGGFINPAILHSTEHRGGDEPCVQLLHLFDPTTFLCGDLGSRIEKKYILPLILSTQVEMLCFFPDGPGSSAFLNELRESFEIAPDEWGYELLLREKLSKIWLQIFAMARPQMKIVPEREQTFDRVKRMMAYIHAHYMETISVGSLAAAAFCSQRECYRAFQSCLHMTPNEYLRSYRLQMARRMLLRGDDTLTAIAHDCGFGSSSYFCKAFLKAYGCTPKEFRDTSRKLTE